MLKKLLKYDLKGVYKILVIFYSLSLFFAILTRMFLSVDNSFIIGVVGKVCSGVTISMIFNILVNNVLRLLISFKNNFYGDESYLTHTLPVEKKTLYLSKTLSSVISLFTSALVICITLFIAYYSKENIQFVKGLLLPLAAVYDSTIVIILLEFILICFLEIMNMVQSGYVGIVLGHKQNNNKFGFSLLYGFVTYLMTQAFTLLIVFITALFNKELMNLFFTIDTLNVSTIKVCIYLALLVYILNILILYFINTRLFSKRVNVD